jgi:hypothetical protein
LKFSYLSNVPTIHLLDPPSSPPLSLPLKFWYFLSKKSNFWGYCPQNRALLLWMVRFPRLEFCVRWL